ncbi:MULTISPECIES: hypothetical protein [unclassified Variovorax]|jgi:hypothetical protein|uniref:hypothetical protein n=1 Tax=unclassified Variovorax TaxID=663243 RepID=UPI0013DF70B0|nr:MULTISPECIES: hypothetical protein [unclassified Variovorax]
MAIDLFHVLCALAVLFIPLGFAWFAVSRTARRHSHDTRRREPKRDDAAPRKDPAQR